MTPEKRTTPGERTGGRQYDLLAGETDPDSSPSEIHEGAELDDFDIEYPDEQAEVDDFDIEYPDEEAEVELDDPRNIAAHYARSGLRVFPVQRSDIKANDKRPLLGYDWLDRATSNVMAAVADADEACTKWGDDNVYIAWALGLDGYCAADLDVDDPPSWWPELEDVAAMNHTKRGHHLVMRIPDGRTPGNSVSKFPPPGKWGEFRGVHGYIVIAGPDRPGFDVAQLEQVGEFPHPEWLTDVGDSAPAVTPAEVETFVKRHTKPESKGGADLAGYRVDAELARLTDYLDGWQEGATRPNGTVYPNARHDTAKNVAVWIAKDADKLCTRRAVKALKDWWERVMADDPKRRDSSEVDDLLAWAVAQFGDEHEPPPNNDPDTGEALDDEAEKRMSRFTDGAQFLLDDDPRIEPVWGDGDEVLWAAGEPMILAGGIGAGKTTLSTQLVGARLGIIDKVLGWPVTPTSSRVLYLAMDRPNQIRRAMRRLLGDEAHRETLAERLVIWPGPPPEDIAKRPELLLELAAAAGADTVFIDSLKDAAVGLTEDAVGSAVNRAMQHCVAHGVEVVTNHHARKAQGDNKKPNTLADIYGSTWITSGAGSVLFLFGQPGQSTVELLHLKPPVADVGPLKVEHDHDAGTSRLVDQWDPLQYLRHRGDQGATTADAAQAMTAQVPTSASRKKAERALDRLVLSGLAVKRDAVKGGAGGTQAARYWLPEHRIGVA